MTALRTVLVVALAAGLAACASRQTTETTPTPPPVVTQPETTTPAPTRPVVSTPAPTRPTGPIPGTLADFKVTVGERVFFDYDQYALRADARSTLESQAAWLKTYPQVRIVIAGHADERGTREYNLALGARRAASAKDYLVSLGVPASRIETVSYGKERPFAAGSNEEAWALNRNAHTQIVSGAAS